MKRPGVGSKKEIKMENRRGNGLEIDITLPERRIDVVSIRPVGATPLQSVGMPSFR